MNFEKFIKNKKLLFIILGIILIEFSGNGIFSTIIKLFN